MTDLRIAFCDKIDRLDLSALPDAELMQLRDENLTAIRGYQPVPRPLVAWGSQPFYRVYDGEEGERFQRATCLLLEAMNPRQWEGRIPWDYGMPKEEDL